MTGSWAVRRVHHCPVSFGSLVSKDAQFAHVPGLSISLLVALLIPHQMLAIGFRE